MILSDEEKRNTAYHEAGHALVAAMTPGADQSTGHHHSARHGPRPNHATAGRRQHTYTRTYLETMLAVLMGGRSAEEIFLGHITTGAATTSSAPQKSPATWSANGYERTRPASLWQKRRSHLPGREINQHRDYSEDTAIQIDKEVKRIVSEGYEQAKHMLSNNRETLEP